MSSSSQRNVAQDLAAQLEGEAELVDHGALAIDAEQALDKLGRYQLADPHHYVLRLAEAGVRLGAKELWFWTSPDSLVAHFVYPDGVPSLDAETLDKLLTVLIGARLPGSVGARVALVQLAVAVNTVRGLEPVQLWIESADEEGEGHRLALEGEPELTPIHGALPGLVVRVRLPLAMSSWGARLRRRPEARLLAERATWAWVPIVLDNRQISRGFRLPYSQSIHSADGRLIGKLTGSPGFSRAPPCVVLCAAGIEVERHRPEGAAPGLFAVVEAGLERDLGFARFIRGPAFDELLAQVLAVGAETKALAPRRAASLQRRPTPAGQLGRAVSWFLAVSLFVMFFVGGALRSEALVLIAAAFGIMAGPLLIIFGSEFANNRMQIVNPEAVKLPSEQRRELPTPAQERPLALPPA